MSDERSLSDKASIVILSRILVTLIETANGVILWKLLAVDDAAVLGVLLLVFNTTKQIAHLGFPESVFYFFGKLARGARRGFLFQTLAIVGVTSIVAAGIIFGLSASVPYWVPEWSAESQNLLAAHLPLLAIVALLEFPTWPVPNMMLASDHPRHSAAYNFVMSVLLVSMVLTPALLGWGLTWIVYGLLTYGAVRFLVTLVWMLLLLPEGGTPLPVGTWREQVSFAMPLGLNAFATKLNKSLDKAVVAWLLPEASSAVYMLATYDVPFIPAIPMGLGAVMITRYVRLVTEGRRDEVLALWHKAVHKAGLAVLPLSVLAIVAAPDLFPIALKPEAAGAVVPFQIFCVILMTRPAKFSAMLQAHGDTPTQFRSTLVSLAVNAALSIPLTMLLGVVGTALATLVAMVVMRIYVVAVIARHLDTPMSHVMPWRDSLRTLALSLVTAGVLVAMRTLLLPAGPQPAAIGLIVGGYLPIYFGLGWLTGAIRRDDWTSLAYLLRIRRG